jgi:hypothetical protein
MATQRRCIAVDRDVAGCRLAAAPMNAIRHDSLPRAALQALLLRRPIMMTIKAVCEQVENSQDFGELLYG